MQVDGSGSRSDSLSGSVSVVVYCRCKIVQMHANAVSSLHFDACVFLSIK